MAERTVSASSLTRRAIELINDHELDDARLVLAEALALDPNFEQAWLWFAHIAEDTGERRFCLERAAAINPDSTARQELPKLRQAAPVQPPEVADILPPPLPPGLSGEGPAPRRPLPRPQRLSTPALVIAALALLALVAGTLILARRPSSPVYIAVAGGMTGAGSAAGQEVVDSVNLHVDLVNANGGINGHHVEVLVYDDENDPPKAAEVAREIVEDGRPLLVIGHTISSTSAAAGPIYAEAGMPVITGTANADDVTADNPWYFRTIFGTRMLGLLIAAYAQNVLDVERMTVIARTDDYGRSLGAGVIQAFVDVGGSAAHLVVDGEASDLDAEIAAAVAQLQEMNDPGLLVLAQQSNEATPTIAAIRRAGIDAQMLGGDSIGSNRFLTTFADMPEEVESPGFFTDGLYAAAPVFVDSLTSDSLRWFDSFQDAYDQDPTWRGATTFDAAIAATTAMNAVGPDLTGPDVRQTRMAIRDALVALDSPENAVAGLLGPIYFDAEGATPRSAAFGIATGNQYSSAFEQLRPYATSANLGLDEDLASGVAIEVDGIFLERQRVVFTGINFNEVGELDTANPSFFADFFLWFNYTGDDSATDIVLTIAAESDLTLGEPIRVVEDNGQTYALFRVAGRFKSSFEFQDFPFDRQSLVVSFQNQVLPSSKLVYAVDPEFIALPQKKRLMSGSNAAVSINAIPSWETTSLLMFQESVGSTALMGDPEANVGSGGIEYSLLTAEVTIHRDLVAFLVKNLLPLALLAAITYVSLFFPHSQTGERVAFAVSAILTAAVLLTTVTAVLPQVGYTVAIEWGFYAFIFLSAICIIIGLVGDWLYEDRRYSELRKLDRFSHIFYPLFLLAVVAAYAWRYGG